jgi:DNA topoisomerase-2
MNPILRRLFREEDDIILSHVVDEGAVVEPHYYIGVVPPVLINGADGTGTGYKTLIPSYNPLDIIACCLKMAEAGLEDGLGAAEVAELPSLEPYFDGFNGMVWVEGSNIFTRGCYEIDLETNRLIITELPPGKWTEDVVDHIRDRHMVVKDVVKDVTKEKKRKTTSDASPDGANGKSPTKTPLVTDLFDGSSEYQVRIEIEIIPEKLEAMVNDADLVYATFGDLNARMSTKSMHAFDTKGKLCHMHHPHDAFRSHVTLRFDAYTRRRAHQIDNKKRELKALREKLMFVTLVTDGELIIGGRSIDDISSDLVRHGFEQHGEQHAFNHLLRITMMSITTEKADALRHEVAHAEEELAKIEALTEFGIWKVELLEFKDAYATFLEAKKELQGDDASTVTKGIVKKKRKGTAGAKGRK